MNYLAHFILSDGDPGLIVGNFVADHIKNQEVASYSPSIQRGIMLHRFIDSYTDQHPVVKQSTKRLQPTQRKYAPVVVDICYDLMLARNWEKYSESDLQSFANTIYNHLTDNTACMSVAVQQRLAVFVAHNWLMGYTTLDGLGYVFMRMQQRLRFENSFPTAAKDIVSNFSSLESDFLYFFDDLRSAVRNFLTYE